MISPIQITKHLHIFCKEKNASPENIKILIEKDFNFNFFDNFGFSPLHYLFQNSVVSSRLIELLQEKKINFNCKDEHFNFSIVLINHIRNQIILDKNKIITENYLNNTPLHFLFENKNIELEMIEILVEKKCDFNTKNSDNQTPLYYLCNNQNVSPEMIKFLFKNGIDFGTKEKPSLYHCLSTNQSLQVKLENLKISLDLLLSNISPFSLVKATAHYYFVDVELREEFGNYFIEFAPEKKYQKFFYKSENSKRYYLKDVQKEFVVQK